ncbi:MAG TPA: N-acetylmuramoyl-L-alanine amidase [Alphaproteobacteria bacterium]|nr:N-acetylmuramoyl-L-alanine amidase [Alphaproteobacteria bacterium]
MIERPSPNHNARPPDAPIDILLMHYTGMETAEIALARLCDPAAQVSAHYTIDEDGSVYWHVPEDRRAWHAGKSFWAGETDVNGRSIGIELVNPGHEFGYRAFPEAQMAALIPLAQDIIARHAIPAARVLGHSDVAPDRRQDPGELFDWARLAEAGIGLWPTATAERSTADARSMLARIGYDVTVGGVIAAFQRHFRPAKVDGVVDAETHACLDALTAALDY